MTDLELLRTQLKRLGLRTMAQVFEEEAQKAAKTQMSYTAYLARLTEEKALTRPVIDALEKEIDARIREAVAFAEKSPRPDPEAAAHRTCLV